MTYSPDTGYDGIKVAGRQGREGFQGVSNFFKVEEVLDKIELVNRYGKFEAKSQEKLNPG